MACTRTSISPGIGVCLQPSSTRASSDGVVGEFLDAAGLDQYLQYTRNRNKILPDMRPRRKRVEVADIGIPSHAAARRIARDCGREALCPGST